MSAHSTADPKDAAEWKPWAAQVAALVDGAMGGAVDDGVGSARRVAAGVLGRLVGAQGLSVEGLGLRLTEGIDADDAVVRAVPEVPGPLRGPDLIGTAYELALNPGRRRAHGGHHTSPPLASALVGWALETGGVSHGRTGSLSVLDPAVGGGAFLLAAARWQVARGLDPLVVLSGLRGIDIDPDAVAVAEAALVLWAVEAGVPAEVALRTVPPRLTVGDALSASGEDGTAAACEDACGRCAVGPGRATRFPAPDPAVQPAEPPVPAEPAEPTGRAHRAGLTDTPGRLVGAPVAAAWVPGPVDVVVGNPPFLGQLSRTTARSRGEAARLRAFLGDAAGGYVDTAALFMLAALDRVRPGGLVALILPESVLGSRDGARAREAVSERAEMIGLWVADGPAFDAAVDVCAPVLVRRDGGRAGAIPSPRPVALARGLEFRSVPASPAPAPSSRAGVRAATWSPLLAAAREVPPVELATGAGSLGDLVRATAGFRQHFYGVAAHLGEAPEGWSPDGCSTDTAAPDTASPGAPAGRQVAVATVGMVDPMVVGWGRRPVRIGGTRWRRPVLDLDDLERDSPEVERWVRARLVPKVLLAPQVRIVEAAADAGGAYVPGVPLVSIEPVGSVEALDSTDPDGPLESAGPPTDSAVSAGAADEDVLWLVVAALSAPPVSAWAMQRAAGTGRGRDAFRLAARQVLDVPLPPDRTRWRRAAAALRSDRPLVEVGPDLTAAYGLDPAHPVTAWWASRLPPHRF